MATHEWGMADVLIVDLRVPRPGGSNTPSGANTRSTRLPSENRCTYTVKPTLLRSSAVTLCTMAQVSFLAPGGAVYRRFANPVLGLDGAAFGRRRCLRPGRCARQQGQTSQGTAPQQAAPLSDRPGCSKGSAQQTRIPHWVAGICADPSRPAGN